MASRPSLAAGSSATSSAATATSMPRSSSRVAIVRHPPAPSHCVRAPGHFEGCCGNCEWPDYARQCSYHGRDGPILHIIRRLRLYECQYSHWLVYNFTNLVSATFPPRLARSEAGFGVRLPSQEAPKTGLGRSPVKQQRCPTQTLRSSPRPQCLPPLSLVF